MERHRPHIDYSSYSGGDLGGGVDRTMITDERISAGVDVKTTIYMLYLCISHV